MQLSSRCHRCFIIWRQDRNRCFTTTLWFKYLYFWGIEIMNKKLIAMLTCDGGEVIE